MGCLVALISSLAVALGGGPSAPAAGAAERLPIVGTILEGALSPTSPKAPPEPVDMELFERMMDEGLLGDHPCEWFVPIADDA